MRRALFLSLLTAHQLGGQTPAYRITQTYPLGGEGRWDYLALTPRTIACSSAGRPRHGGRRDEREAARR
jgi:hypothetical protein